MSQRRRCGPDVLPGLISSVAAVLSVDNFFPITTTKLPFALARDSSTPRVVRSQSLTTKRATSGSWSVCRTEAVNAQRPRRRSGRTVTASCEPRHSLVIAPETFAVRTRVPATSLSRESPFRGIIRQNKRLSQLSSRKIRQRRSKNSSCVSRRPPRRQSHGRSRIIPQSKTPSGSAPRCRGLGRSGIECSDTLPVS